MTQRRPTLSQPHVPTRELILQEAERLIEKKGVAGFALKDVVAPLGVRVPSVYKHYSSRDDVLVALSRRYIEELAGHFAYPPEALEHPIETLKQCVLEYVRFHITHPAYVRLALVDLATPNGGIEYLRLAAGGPFSANVTSGPLAAMHRRLRKLLIAGQQRNEFRPISPVDFFRVVKGSLLLRLVFPDDLLVAPGPSANLIRSIEAWTWDVAHQYVLTRSSGAEAGSSLAPLVEPDG